VSSEQCLDAPDGIPLLNKLIVGRPVNPREFISMFRARRDTCPEPDETNSYPNKVSFNIVACRAVAMRRPQDGQIPDPFLGNGSVDTFTSPQQRIDAQQ
jgi:hypothetical protein